MVQTNLAVSSSTKEVRFNHPIAVQFALGKLHGKEWSDCRGERVEGTILGSLTLDSILVPLLLREPILTTADCPLRVKWLVTLKFSHDPNFSIKAITIQNFKRHFTP
ncbi:hypothetical protein EVAR_93554_1 [Eumeta japonica]|uniref:Uncharacterized protein n=1 Tax=Eumeta variegata TaxID=151549 RepID=A0A4C1URG6_EUMVA|nr:hypothetical protein EVAR_93554_1 [Eumeta japonica]